MKKNVNMEYIHGKDPADLATCMAENIYLRFVEENMYDEIVKEFCGNDREKREIFEIGYSAALYTICLKIATGEITIEGGDVFKKVP